CKSQMTIIIILYKRNAHIPNIKCDQHTLDKAIVKGKGVEIRKDMDIRIWGSLEEIIVIPNDNRDNVGTKVSENKLGFKGFMYSMEMAQTYQDEMVKDIFIPTGRSIWCRIQSREAFSARAS